jgi:hypothetical protein
LRGFSISPQIGERSCVHRALSVGGCLLHEWGNGESGEGWVQIREQARRLFERAGLPVAFHPGVRSEAEVDEQLGDLRFGHEASVDIGRGPEITLREFLRRLADGELSYILGRSRGRTGQMSSGPDALVRTNVRSQSVDPNAASTPLERISEGRCLTGAWQTEHIEACQLGPALRSRRNAHRLAARHRPLH